MIWNAFIKCDQSRYTSSQSGHRHCDCCFWWTEEKVPFHIHLCRETFKSLPGPSFVAVLEQAAASTKTWSALNRVQPCRHAPRLVGACDSEWARGPSGTVPIPFQNRSSLNLLTVPGRRPAVSHACELLGYADPSSTVEEDEVMVPSCWRPAPLPDFMRSHSLIQSWRYDPG